MEIYKMVKFTEQFNGYSPGLKRDICDSVSAKVDQHGINVYATGELPIEGVDALIKIMEEAKKYFKETYLDKEGE